MEDCTLRGPIGWRFVFVGRGGITMPADSLECLTRRTVGRAAGCP